MMKSIVLFAFVVCAYIAVIVNAMPAAVEDVAAISELTPELEQAIAAEAEAAPSRQKRATCDLLSGTGANHSACAAHCILRGNRGGYCNSRAVCVCRN